MNIVFDTGNSNVTIISKNIADKIKEEYDCLPTYKGYGIDSDENVILEKYQKYIKFIVRFSNKNQELFTNIVYTIIAYISNDLIEDVIIFGHKSYFLQQLVTNNYIIQDIDKVHTIEMINTMETLQTELTNILNKFMEKKIRCNKRIKRFT